MERNLTTNSLASTLARFFGVLLLSVSITSHAQSIVPVDPPNSTGTTPLRVHNGNVVGVYDDAVGIRQGFLFTRSGDFITYSAPGAYPQLGTYGIGVDFRGIVTGYYLDISGASHGFTRFPNGTIDTYDHPRANANGTEPRAVNYVGTSVGIYWDDEAKRGYARTVFGHYTSINVPAAKQTVPTSINNVGEIAGWFDRDQTFTWRGFIRSKTGQYTKLDQPDACQFVDDPLYINNRGDVATSCDGGVNGWYGYLRKANGAVTVFYHPTSQFFSVAGIADNGDIYGTYLVQPGGRARGFIRSSTGEFTDIVFPGSEVADTSIMSVDGEGNAVGSYNELNAPFHGFVRYAPSNH